MQTEYGFPCREAKPVWLPDGSQPNRYVQFLQKFTWDGDGALSLQLSCDSRARVCLNGERIGFAFYDGTDDTSWYETFDLSAAAVRGVVSGRIQQLLHGGARIRDLRRHARRRRVCGSQRRADALPRGYGLSCGQGPDKPDRHGLVL